ncbi:MAG: twin-arginine translocase subunit TatC [Nanohaloarchaea archaeon SW_4_43_9]|nr:MAG: twin-arginine translocase subunit TatC [Nanohaloarchaea archaeon SW_4_43_9]
MNKQPVEQHLIDLKKRLRNSLLALAFTTVAGFIYSSRILSWLQDDLSLSLHALTAYEVFYTRISIALLFGLVMALPFIALQLLKFAKPGLKPREYRVVRNYLPFSLILFSAGAVFSYQFVVKSALSFFSTMTRASDVTAVWGLQNTIGFAVKLSAFSGLMFQLPVISVVLASAGIIDKEMMVEHRGYFVVAVLLLSAVATPPDVVTQVLVTLPVLGLYQVSIWLVGRYEH